MEDSKAETPAANQEPMETEDQAQEEHSENYKKLIDAGLDQKTAAELEKICNEGEVYLLLVSRVQTGCIR